MLKHRTKMLALLLIIASITLFFSCQEQQPVATSDGSNFKLAKETSLILPAGSTLDSAFLNLYVENHRIPPPHWISIHKILSDWDEQTATWNNFGGFNATIEATFETSPILVWKTINITDVVQDWLNGEDNYGLLLKNRDVIVGIANWDSKESANPDLIPYLKVYINGDPNPIEVEPTDDTHINENLPDTHSGNDPKIWAGILSTDPLIRKYALIRFDIQTAPQVECETAYAYGGNVATCFLDLSPINANNWGWTNYIGEGSYDWPIYAGAGQCDISKGTLVGNLSVEYVAGTVSITYELDPGFTLDEMHVWVGTTPLPIKRGKYVTAPGQFNNNGENPVVVNGLSGNIWIAAHAGVCWEVTP